MSFKSHLLTGGKATGYGIAGEKRRKLKAKLYSTYSLGTLAGEDIVAQLASAYELSTAPT